MKAVLCASLVLAAALAGCAKDPPAVEHVAPGPSLLLAGPALYPDPQNTPHPAFGWPTLSHPTNGTGAPVWWQPANMTMLPETISGLQHVVQTPGVEAGAGIALFGSLAVVPGYGAPTAVVDISEPTAPVVLSTFESQLGGHRGATIIAYPTGRLVTVIATGSGLDIWDITDPTKPMGLAPIDDIGSHKVGVVPGTPIVYNARSGGGGTGSGASATLGSGVTEMFDLTDPANPVRLPDFENGYACHHIYFWNDLEQQKFRAICAGIQFTQIIDTTDPRAPKVIVSVPYGLGLAGGPSMSASTAAFSHYAGLSLDGTMLMVGDENGGGGLPPGCVGRVDTPAGSVSVPVGAVWFYDVTDETDPVYKGHISASQLDKAGADLQGSCTAHHGRLLPTPGRDLLAMSFYTAGVIVVDFSELRGETPGLPSVVAQYADGSDTWETWYYNGYLFTGDLARGMDVLRFE